MRSPRSVDQFEEIAIFTSASGRLISTGPSSPDVMISVGARYHPWCSLQRRIGEFVLLVSGWVQPLNVIAILGDRLFLKNEAL